MIPKMPSDPRTKRSGLGPAPDAGRRRDAKIPSPVTMPGAVATIGAGTFQNSVQPTYIKLVPLKDGWSSWFLYTTANNNQDYIATSNGKDGTAQAFVGGPTSNFNADIVFCDGQFMQYAENLQK